MMPPMTHTASMSGGSGHAGAIVAGVRKMPEPIVTPITSPIALQSRAV
jgi:hypothetical protein